MKFIDQEQPARHVVVPISSTTHHNTWVEINAHALEHNIKNYKAIVAPALLAPVIKSNAYGHGINTIAKILDNHRDVGLICVASLSEAIALRGMGIGKPLLVLSIIDADLQNAVMYDIDTIIYNLHDALELNAIAQRLNKQAKVHIKVDTGLSRLGLLQEEAIKLAQVIHALPAVILHGIFTHFASAESSNQAFTNQQISQFNRVIDILHDQGIWIPLKHTASSAATTANQASHFTMPRIGIGLYGLWPSQDNKELTALAHPEFSLQPILTWKTRIIQIKEIPAGSHVGYNLTYQASRKTRIATLPIGYWDGYDRRLSNKGMVLINNQLAPVVGIVAMNLTMVDVTDIQAAPGDEVTLLGNHPGVTAEDIAKHCKTINYEIVTRINPLINRIIK